MQSRRQFAGVAGVLWIGFSAFRFWQALLVPRGIWQDSHSYRAVSRFSLFSSGFWAGSRPPLIPLVLKIAGTPGSFIVLQTAISVVAWGFLAWRVGSLTSEGWRQVVVVAIVLAFACTETVAEWDWSVLSESLALSALAGIFAFSIGYARTRKTTEAVGLVCAGTAFAFARDEGLWTVAFLGLGALCAAGIWARRMRRGRTRGGAPSGAVVSRGSFRGSSRGSSRRAVQRTALLGLSLILIAAVADLAAVDSHRDIPELVDVLSVRIFPYPDRVAWFASHGMPDGESIDRIAGATPPISRGVYYVNLDFDGPEFSDLKIWIDSNGPSTYSLWLIEHPGYDIESPFEKPQLTFNDANGNLGFYASPSRLGTSGLDTVLFPGLLGELLMIAIGILCVIERRLVRSQILGVLVALAALGALGPVSMLVAWHGESQEVTRHMVEGSVETRLAILLFVLVALLCPSSPRDRLKGDAPEARAPAKQPAEEQTAGQPV